MAGRVYLGAGTSRASTSVQCSTSSSQAARPLRPLSRRAAVVAAARRDSSVNAASTDILGVPVPVPELDGDSPRVSPFATDLEDANFCGVDGAVMDHKSPENIPKNGKKYHIHTFGCQMNSADSERMAGALDALGYEFSTEPKGSDVIIYNTCSIREKAETKVYSALGRMAKSKRARMGDLTIVVAGCVAQQEGAQLLRRCPEVDLVMGPQHANRIGDLLGQVDQGAQVVATEELEIMEDVTVARRESDITAWVNVIYGCNEKCTYCVVPNTRGSEKSRQPKDILNEMATLGTMGYKEVTLLGQNVDAYGRDLPGMATDNSGRRLWTFTDLLEYVHDAPGIERIRFATSHPRYFTNRLIKKCAELPKLCEFFHIPFQSGDDDILRDMKRGYTHERYRRIIDDIRRYMPDASVSGDVIVGFPGETEEQFERTVALVREVGFDRVNTAAYSPRPMTPAADWPNQVADLIKADRLIRLNDVVNETAEVRAQRFQDREVEVLVEGVNPRNEGQAMGRNRQNKVVFFDAEDPAALRGQLVGVHINKCNAYTLYGDLVQ